jgi:hypothetical protein
MSSAATIILGLQDLGFWSAIGFSLVALSTATTGIEAFFNWRSRWIFAEAAQYSLYRLQDDLDYLVARKDPLELADLDPCTSGIVLSGTGFPCNGLRSAAEVADRVERPYSPPREPWHLSLHGTSGK